LAKAIEDNPGEVLSDRVREYLCRLLRGQAKKKPGPNRSPEKTLVMETLAAALYQEELARLQTERKNLGCPKVKGDLAPHEEACQSVQ
jgi:hypothetical protein